MQEQDKHNHLLIRDGAVLLRIQRDEEDRFRLETAEFFDVRTGVKLKTLLPELKETELRRAYKLTDESAWAIIKAGAATGAEPTVDLSKVVSILDVKQRRLDNVVADSILYQIEVIRDLLDQFLQVAKNARNEDRFWMSQQVLALLEKFSGREMAELEDLIEWMRSHSRK